MAESYSGEAYLRQVQKKREFTGEVHRDQRTPR